ncbi:LPS export ABC transporter permease LptF [Chromatium weissei]|nr:LPS export ABC transporter permease LptF [Chromatium weissei]
MLNLIDRYLLHEIAKVFAAIVIILLLIVTSLMFLRILEEVNLGALNVELVFAVLRLQLLRDTASLLPPAFFLAVLVTLSRLSRDSELIALNACGIGPPRLYRMVLVLALPVALLTAWFALWLQPEAASAIQDIRLQQREQAAQIAGLQPGRFYIEENGQVVIYIGEITERKSLSNIFILDRRNAQTQLVVSAGGQHRLDSVTGDHLITLKRGQRFDGNSGSGAFLMGHFEDYLLRVRSDNSPPRLPSKRTTLPTSALLTLPERGYRAELEHRIAAPLAIITLAILAIPLVEISPRHSATGRLLLALLAYFCFFNLQRLAESWLEFGVTPLWMGSLWYQCAILGVVYLILLPESFWLKRARQRWRSTSKSSGCKSTA